MLGKAILLRFGLLLAVLPLVQCHDDDGHPAPAGALAIVDAFPNLSFSAPVFFAQAPGDAARAFVVTQAGIVHAFPFDAVADETTPFLDLDSRVTDAGGEQGLLGFAFDPDFVDNGYVYANYNPNFDDTGLNPRRTHISRFQVTGDPDSIDPATEDVLLSYEQPYSNHNGGWLGFGPDDHLYVASGDGGSGGDPGNLAQDLDSPLGKILRIEPDGGIPPDNPFVGSGRGEIWAYGLRNPWRAGFDRATGELWAGDVGQGELEEIDIIRRGGNYGWRKYEGTRVHEAGDPAPPGAIFPVHEYRHADGRCSITGGYVYRGSVLVGHRGWYFYADFCTGELWGLQPGDAGWTRHFIGTVPGNPTSFGEDLAGELFVTSFDGHVYKLVPAD